MQINPLDPVYLKGFNAGKTAGKKEAAGIFNEFLTERMESLINVDGIGEKTAEKVHFHFIERLGEDEKG